MESSPCPMPAPRLGDASPIALEKQQNLLLGDPPSRVRRHDTAHVQTSGVILRSWQRRGQNPLKPPAPFNCACPRTPDRFLKSSRKSKYTCSAEERSPVKRECPAGLRSTHGSSPPLEEPETDSGPCLARTSIAGDHSKGGDTSSILLFFLLFLLSSILSYTSVIVHAKCQIIVIKII